MSLTEAKINRSDWGCASVGVKDGLIVLEAVTMPPDVALLLAAEIVTTARRIILQNESLLNLKAQGLDIAHNSV